MKKGMTIDHFRLDQTFEKQETITEEMINGYAEVIGDNNPIHLDEDYAKKSIFKTRIAHGILQACILSSILGIEFPGIGTIYLSQTLKFIKPVFIGDIITFRLKVLEINKDMNRLHLETTCSNQKDMTVMTGEAIVMPPI